ncbi:MAG: tRNA uridine-5-carboxymethylaminomethyl(34) synthesis GTPase MnmE [Gammaproteobacteria bacterium]|nr:MAG: tRNA uridine-5-carboxymethylaminomethyl(34) synthesis GTPase MnmE [Gammaproteobacteria bacterium]
MNTTPAYIEDTIVAAATPPGKGGIGVVRISGPGTAKIATQMLGELPIPRYATLAEFRGPDGVPIDAGLALYFPTPDSFTGETVLELQGHGGPLVMSLLVDAAIALGARRAQPGEFSKRAFLNGKLDLIQAEAVADLIDSGTARGARAALRSLVGTFSKAVEELQEQLTRLRLHVEAAIDFPEEEIDFLDDAKLQKQIEKCADAIDSLKNETRIGSILRDGFQVVILGKPNAGKSSLLNALSGQDAAIVTEVAGTTRDILRESIDIDGLIVELVDTAGLRDDPDMIEAEGIKRARNALKNADAILWIQDATQPAENNHEEDIAENIPQIILRNKTDVTGDSPGVQQQDPAILNISAKTGAGLDALRETIRQVAGYENLGDGAFTARRRHIDALNLAAQHFECGRDALNKNKAGEIFAEELKLAQSALGEITGSFTSDDLLGRIFSEFCIGK